MNIPNTPILKVSPELKSLYDTKEDHRKNLHELSNEVVDVEKVKACSRAVGCIVFEEDLLKTNVKGKEGYCIKNVTLLSQFVNPSENFAKEPVMRSGTAFLALAPNLVLTMGHCIFKKDVKDDKLTSGNIVDDKFIIFDYKIRKNGEFKNFFKERNVYRILTVLAAHKESSEVGLDWALLLLDRAVVKRTPLKLNFHSKYEEGTKVHMIGHPEGLPVKYTGEASIRLVNDSLEDNSHMFFTNLDAFHGNSGSPVFDTHHEVIGILRLGQPDRPKYGKRTAYIYPRWDENGWFQSAFGEGVLKISSLKFIRKCFKELQETDFYPAISNTLNHPHSQSYKELPPGLTLERSCVDCPPRKKKKILKPLGFRQIQKIEPFKEMGPIEKCAECNTLQTVHTLVITKCHLIIQKKQKVVEQNDYDLPVPFKLKLSDSISVETKALIENVKVNPSINHEDLLQLNLSKSIASLDLSQCALLENKSLEYISNHLKEALVKLDMSGCKFTKEGLSTLLPLSSLIELNLSGCDFEYCLDWIPPSVTTLHLNGCKLDENTIKNLAGTIKNLHVSQCGIDDSILDALCKHLPALEGLDVSGNPSLTDLTGLNKLNLKELNVIHCAEITEKSWLLVEDEKLKNLEKLGITLKDDKEGANLLSRLSKEKLVSLDLQASKGLEGGVFDCLQKFESLSFLSFRECSNLKIKNLNKYLKGLKKPLNHFDLRETEIEELSLINIPMLTGRMIAGMQLSQNTKVDKLAAIDLSDVEAEHLIPFLKKCKVLNLNGSIRLTSDILEKLLFEISDDIGELHLASTALTDNCLKILSGKVSHCKKLNFNNCTQITTPALKNFILELPNDIKEVYFYKTNLLNECAIKLLPKLAHCTRFNLNNLIHISPWILGNLLKKLPEMTELYLGCTQMKDEAALVLPPKIKKCMRLNINNWEDISSQILSQIIESLPEDIQEIYLKNTQLTDDIAEKLAPKLKECSGLNISDCKQLSEKGLEIILKNLDPNINWLGISGLKKQFEQIKNEELMEKFSKWITS